MLRIFGFLIGVIVCDLIAIALIIVIECILDVFHNRKNGSHTVKCRSAARADYDMPRAGQCNRYHIQNSAAEIHAAVALMARDAHDTAVRDSQWLHDDSSHMSQQAHDTAVYDHQAAVDYHDQYIAAPDFGCSNPFI